MARVLINEVLTYTRLPRSMDRTVLIRTRLTLTSATVSSATTAVSHKNPYTISTMIGAGLPGIHGREFNSHPGAPDSLLPLDSAGDAIYLHFRRREHQPYRYSHGFSFGAAASEVIFGRYVISTAKNNCPHNGDHSRGTNAGPLIGPSSSAKFTITRTGRNEFIELRNISASDVALFDPFCIRPTLGASTASISPCSHIHALRWWLVAYRGRGSCNLRANTALPRKQSSVPFAGALRQGEQLELQRPDVPTLPASVTSRWTKFRYNDRAPWPPAADGSGPSAARKTSRVMAMIPSRSALPTPVLASAWPSASDHVTAAKPYQHGLSKRDALSWLQRGAPLFYQCY